MLISVLAYDSMGSIAISIRVRRDGTVEGRPAWEAYGSTHISNMDLPDERAAIEAVAEELFNCASRVHEWEQAGALSDAQAYPQE
jgi:hypothetical protein